MDTCIRMVLGWTTMELLTMSIIADSIPVTAKMTFMERFISKLMFQGSLWQFHLIFELWRDQDV